MTERLVRITDAEVKPVGRVASEELRRRSGEWCIVDGSARHLLMRRPGDARLRLAGEIDQRGVLFDVMALIAQSRWTGVLVVHGGGVTRAIVLDQGDVVDATSDAKRERLFDVLLSRNLVTHDTLDELTRTAAIAGMSIPDALAESHILADAEVERVFAQTTRLVVLGALATDTGSFYFSTETAPARLSPGLPLTSVMMESAQQLDESAAIATAIETEHHIPEREREKDTVPRELAGVYALCDGRRSVAEVARRAGLLGFEAHKAVHALMRLGLVSIKPPRPRGAHYIAEIYSDALFIIHQRAEASCVGKELREGLGRFIAHNPPLAALLRDAGPLLDGSLVAERVARTLALRQIDAPIANLMRRLDELISFALFMASSLLGTATAAALRTSVAERLAPLERASDSVAPPSEGSAPRAAQVARSAQPALTPPLRSGTYAAVKISRNGSDG